VQVLDEADRLLDFPELPRILETVNKKRQTLLFSATVTSACHRRPWRTLEDPRGPWSAQFILFSAPAIASLPHCGQHVTPVLAAAAANATAPLVVLSTLAIVACDECTARSSSRRRSTAALWHGLHLSCSSEHDAQRSAAAVGLTGSIEELKALSAGSSAFFEWASERTETTVDTVRDIHTLCDAVEHRARGDV
jgi:hypothetical protein